MDAYDLFRRLSAGAKFDLKRFKNDASKFKIIKPKITSSAVDVNKTKTENPHNSFKNERVGNSDSEDDDEEPGGSIKIFEKSRVLEMPVVKTKKRKAESQLRLEHQAHIEEVRDAKDIHVSGEDVPDPCTAFDQFGKLYGVHKDVLKKIKKLGYVEPTPIQMQAVPVMLRRREILACAPTGSGKTIAFIIPILHHLKQPEGKGFRALVLEPTKELAKQTYQECCRISEYKKFRCHIIRKVENAKAQFGQNSARKFDILVSTPQKLVHLLHMQPPAISLKSVEWLIIDESDKLFESGKGGFRDQLAEIYRACDSKNVKRAMFSATFTPDVEEWCNYNLDNVVTVLIGERNAAANLVRQELFFVGNEGGKLVAVRDLIKKGLNPPVLVFVQSKERARELFQELVFDGINVEAIHAERTDLEREIIVKNFRLGKIWVLICTELMGRGIDFKGVNLVINYDFPTSAISYIHRIGRTGRAGRPGRAITFFTEEDSVLLRNIAEVMKKSGCPVPAYMLEMKPSDERDSLKWNPVRETISTEPLYDKIKRRKQMQKAKRKYFKQVSNKTHSKPDN